MALITDITLGELLVSIATMVASGVGIYGILGPWKRFVKTLNELSAHIAELQGKQESFGQELDQQSKRSTGIVQEMRRTERRLAENFRAAKRDAEAVRKSQAEFADLLVDMGEKMKQMLK